jgi:isoquinoline 1-oxidoreductase alpha subunit
MQAVALLKANPDPTREEIRDYMNGVLCRCGTYMRIQKAIELASGLRTDIIS